MTDYFHYAPPIQPGEKIFEQNEFATIYAKYDPQDRKTLLGWYFVRGTSDKSDSGYSETLITNTQEVWRSKLTRVNDPQKGQDVAVIVGSSSVYTLSDVGSGKIAIDKKAIALSASDIKEVTLLPSFLTDNSDNAHPKQRLFYIVSTQDSQGYACKLFDLLDEEVNYALPFENSVVKSVVRLSSNRRVWLVFGVVMPAQSDHRITLCAIDEQYLIQSVAQGKILTTADFVTYNIFSDRSSLELEGLFVESFYFDESNIGSQQIALCTSGTSNADVAILTLTEKQTFQLISTASIPLTSHASVFPNHSYFFKSVINPDGSKSLVLVMSGLDESMRIDTLVWKIPTSPLMMVKLCTISFDEDHKQLSSPQVVVSKYYENVKSSEILTGVPGAGANNALYPYTPTWFSVDGFLSFTETALSDKQKQFTLQGVNLLYSPFRLFFNPYQFALSVSAGSPIGSHMDFFPVVVEGGKYIFDQGKILPVRFFHNPDGALDVIYTDSYTDDTKVSKQHFAINGSLSQDQNLTTPSKNSGEFGAFFSASVDFVGQSIVVGDPQLTVNFDSVQIFGLYSSIPYDVQAVQNMPNVSISTSNTVVNGISKSIISSWTAGYNVDAGYSGSIASVHAHFGKFFGGSKMDMSSDQTTVSIHVSSGFSNSDGLHGYGSKFYTWEYPLYNKEITSSPFGYLIVLVPDGFEDSIFNTTDPRIAYKQDYEIGKILTYLGAEKPGYDPANLWFSKEDFTCPADTSGGGTTLTYSKSNSTNKEIQNATDDGLNAAASLSLNGFGFSSNVTAFYSQTNMQNSASSTSTTSDFTITFHSGSVSDQIYEYTIAPLVYSHAENNMLVFSYEIDLIGPGWKKLYQTPDVILMRVYPFTQDLSLSKFSRSIQFSKNQDGSVDISVSLFNNSYTDVNSVTCKVYKGMAIYSNQDANLKNCTLLGTLTVDKMSALSRTSPILQKQNLSKNDVITVEVFHDDLEDVTKKFYWGVYPYEAFNQMELSTFVR